MPWRPDFALPERFTVTCDDDEFPYRVEVLVEVEDSEPVATSVTFARRPGGEPVSPARLRTIPLAAVVRQGVAAAAEPVLSDGTILGREGVPSEVWTWAGSRRRRVMDDDHLQAVADVYRKANPKSRVKAVQLKLGPVSTATAHRWVKAARDRGFLDDGGVPR